MKNIAVSGAVLCLVALSIPAQAQDEAARRTAAEVAARVPLEKAVKGLPYSAETLVETSQALADGNRITQKSSGRVYRDGEGRTRREEDRKDGSITVSITDPAAGFSYSLNAANKIAWRTPVGASTAILGKLEATQVEQRKVEVETAMQNQVRVRSGGGDEASARAAKVEQEKVATEAARAGAAGARGAGGAGGVMIARSRVPEGPLEHKTLDGLAVEGRSSRTVIPAGQIGNEQPLTITNEEWRSTDLGVLVMTRHTDPRSGESTYRLTNIIRAEPDPSLFMVPADYTVRDTGIRKILEAAKR